MGRAHRKPAEDCGKSALDAIHAPYKEPSIAQLQKQLQKLRIQQETMIGTQQLQTQKQAGSRCGGIPAPSFVFPPQYHPGCLLIIPVTPHCLPRECLLHTGLLIAMAIGIHLKQDYTSYLSPFHPHPLPPAVELPHPLATVPPALLPPQPQPVPSKTSKATIAAIITRETRRPPCRGYINPPDGIKPDNMPRKQHLASRNSTITMLHKFSR